MVKMRKETEIRPETERECADACLRNKMEKNSDEARPKQKPASVQFSDQQKVTSLKMRLFGGRGGGGEGAGWFDSPYLIAGGFKARASASSRQISSWHHNTEGKFHDTSRTKSPRYTAISGKSSKNGWSGCWGLPTVYRDLEGQWAPAELDHWLDRSSKGVATAT
jgi:hypothetical protein